MIDTTKTKEINLEEFLDCVNGRKSNVKMMAFWLEKVSNIYIKNYYDVEIEGNGELYKIFENERDAKGNYHFRYSEVKGNVWMLPKGIIERIDVVLQEPDEEGNTEYHHYPQKAACST